MSTKSNFSELTFDSKEKDIDVSDDDSDDDSDENMTALLKRTELDETRRKNYWAEESERS